jgi:transposase
MPQYIGIDLHKATTFVTRMDQHGRILEQVQLRTDAPSLGGYLRRLRPDTRLAVEATGNWMYLYELIEDRCPDLVLAHPLKTKAIASARIKTDKIDATTLAHLLRADLLPAAYIPPRPVRDTREVLRYRGSLGRLQTQVKNKVHAILSKNGLRPPTQNAFSKRARQFLTQVPLRPCYRSALDGYLRLLDALAAEREAVTQRIAAQVQPTRRRSSSARCPGSRPTRRC